MKNYSQIIDAIIFSPLLEDEQRFLLIDELEKAEKGEKISPELAQVIFHFIKTATEFEKTVALTLSDKLEEVDAKIVKIDQEQENLSPEEIQTRANKIISLVNNFLAESKKMSADYDQKIETIIKEKGEQSEIDAIRSKLQN